MSSMGRNICEKHVSKCLNCLVKITFCLTREEIFAKYWYGWVVFSWRLLFYKYYKIVSKHFEWEIAFSHLFSFLFFSSLKKGQKPPLGSQGLGNMLVHLLTSLFFKVTKAKKRLCWPLWMKRSMGKGFFLIDRKLSNSTIKGSEGECLSHLLFQGVKSNLRLLFL